MLRIQLCIYLFRVLDLFRSLRYQLKGNNTKLREEITRVFTFIK
jgi:hypothetical protein